MPIVFLVPLIECIFSTLVPLNIHNTYIYIYILYIYILFIIYTYKCNYVYHKKTILKGHLFIEKISRSVHKLCQCNKPPKVHSTHAEHLLLGEHGTVSACQKCFKRVK